MTHSEETGYHFTFTYNEENLGRAPLQLINVDDYIGWLHNPSECPQNPIMTISTSFISNDGICSSIFEETNVVSFIEESRIIQIEPSYSTVEGLEMTIYVCKNNHDQTEFDLFQFQIIINVILEDQIDGDDNDSSSDSYIPPANPADIEPPSFIG